MPTLTEHFGPMIDHDREGAVAALTRLVEAAPRLLEARALLMRAHHRGLDFARCVESARAVLAIDAANREGLLHLAHSLAALGDDEAALEAYRGAAAQGVGDSYAEARLLHRLGRLDEAAAAYREAAGGCGDEAAPPLFGLMSALRDAGQVEASNAAAAALTAAFMKRPAATSTRLVERHHAFAFPGWAGLAQKAAFAGVLQRASAAEPAGRFPDTFVLPDDGPKLEAYAATRPGALYIGKPARGSGGHGIVLTDEPQSFTGRRDFVVQRYIERPYLIEGRKCHLRIYALVTSVSPLRAYVWREGIVRLASEPYSLEPATWPMAAAHITNTSLNRTHPAYWLSDDPKADDTGSARSLSALLRRLTAEGFDASEVEAGISGLIGWFIRQLGRDGIFERQAEAPPRAYPPKLIGFDVLLDADAKPWLIEMQTSPAVVASALGYRLHAQLCQDALQMTVGFADPGDDLAAAEADIELANAGRYRPLDVGQSDERA